MRLSADTILAGRACCERTGETWDELLVRLCRAELRRLDASGVAPASPRVPLKRKGLAGHLAGPDAAGVHYPRRADIRPTGRYD